MPLIYQSLLAHCKLLEQCCEQFQKAQAKGTAELTTLSAALSTTSSIHQDTVATNNPKCSQCSYSHPHVSHPASGQECKKCNGTGHFTTLCRRPQTNRHPYNSYKQVALKRAEPGPRDSVAAGTQADHLAKTGSPTAALADSPIKASAPATVPE